MYAPPGLTLKIQDVPLECVQKYKRRQTRQAASQQGRPGVTLADTA